MPAILVDKCPDVALIKLPHKDITTFDAKRLKLGAKVYFRFAPGDEATEYVVISDRAIQYQGETKILVIGPRGVPTGMNPTHFVQDKKIWWEFHQKRHGAAPGRS